jgi:hypothetical protein
MLAQLSDLTRQGGPTTDVPACCVLQESCGIQCENQET